MLKSFDIDKLVSELEKKLLTNNEFSLKAASVLWANYSYFSHYAELEIKNKVKYEGEEYLCDLPEKKVMFVSNHQTYIMDAAAIYRKLILCNGKSILNPRLNIGCLIAKETLDSLPYSRLLEMAGCIPIKRSWRSDQGDADRGMDVPAIKKTIKCLKEGWLINFPTGTTDPDADIRPGTASYIKKMKPIVVPVHLSGFRECFGKKGTKSLHDHPSELTVTFKEPLQIDHTDPPEVINAQISCSIKNI